MRGGDSMTYSWDRLNQLSDLLKGSDLEAIVKPTDKGIVTLFKHHSMFLEEVRYVASDFKKRTGNTSSQTIDYIVDTFEVYRHATNPYFWAKIIDIEVEELYKNYPPSMDGIK